MTMHQMVPAAVVPRRGFLRGRHMGAYPMMRGMGQGFDFTSLFSPAGSSSTSALTTAGNAAGAAVGVPGAGSIASGVVSTLSSIFGGNPATGADAERQAHVYSIYETAMTSPGSAASVDAVIELYTMAGNLFDPVNNVQQNNPQATRTYSQQALQMLATQGWQNVNSLKPSYTGVAASGVVYGTDPTTGQAVIVGQNPIAPAGLSGLFSSPLFLPAVLIGGFFLLRGSKASASATVHHTTSSNPRRPRRHNRSRRRSYR
jgi:hypothetical protein